MGNGSTGERTTTTPADGRSHDRAPDGSPRARRRHAGHRRGGDPVSAAAAATLARPERLESRLLFAADVASASTLATATVSWGGHDVQVVQNQYLALTHNEAKFRRLADRQGFTAVKSLGGGGFFQFSSDQPVAQVEALSKHSGLGFATLRPNGVLAYTDTAFNDPLYPMQWGLNNSRQLESFDYNGNGVVTPYNAQLYPSGLPAGTTTEFPTTTNPDENQVGAETDDIRIQKAWDITAGDKSVVIANLDSGIDATHPDLVNSLWTNTLDESAGDPYPGDLHGYDVANNTADLTDDVGHGTHTGGIIAANANNSLGVSGVAPNTSLLTVKLGDIPTDATQIAGVNYCIYLKTHGVNIVAMNESLGDPSSLSYDYPANPLVTESLRQAGQAGILAVFAAGNFSLNVDTNSAYPPKYSNELPNVITVAAVDNQFKLASFSNYGSTTVDLAAPGVNILSTTPVNPDPLTIAVPFTEFGDPTTAGFYQNYPTDTPYGYESGTSTAAPFVTGVLALEAAANPLASPAQLKQALLQSTTFDPNLGTQNGKPPLVRTSGVANAFGAVLAIQNPFALSDTSRGGAWAGYYGSAGAYVIGDSTAATFPFANVTTEGGTPVIVQNVSKNAAATQRLSDLSERVLAYQGAAKTETIHLAFTDGASHRTALYVLDADHQRRTETVTIVDRATGRTVDSRTVSDFTKGQYLIWDLRGTVDIVVTADAGSGGGAVFSGVFFDPTPTRPVAYQNTDAGTLGANWRDVYGSQGQFIAGDTTGLTPTYLAALDITGGTLTTLRSASRNKHGLSKPSDPTRTIQAYYETASSMDVNLNIADNGQLHTVTLYLADYNNQRRTERVQAIDAATGAVMAQQDVTDFRNGQFLSFNVTGGVIFRIGNTAGPGKTAVLSGIFFDAPFGALAHFAGANNSIGGNYYQGPYGASGAYVVGDNFPGVDVVDSNVAVSITGASRAILASATRDRRALLKTGLTNNRLNRVAAYAYSATTMTVDYTPTDSSQHQLTLYFADLDNQNRAQTVTLYTVRADGTTNVLTRQTLTNFRNGRYLTYNVVGPIHIDITNAGYPNAILNGLFID